MQFVYKILTEETNETTEDLIKINNIGELIRSLMIMINKMNGQSVYSPLSVIIYGQFDDTHEYNNIMVNGYVDAGGGINSRRSN